MVGMGVVELILLAMMTGGSVPQQIAFGNPAIWLAQSVVTRSIPAGAVAGAWLMLEEPMPPPVMPMTPPPQVAPPGNNP
ncbi:MAG: hypothetical protein RIF41_02885 [Polyangiaceae bacterium]